jgi:hypothetical protein
MSDIFEFDDVKKRRVQERATAASSELIKGRAPTFAGLNHPAPCHGAASAALFDWNASGSAERRSLPLLERPL